MIKNKPAKGKTAAGIHNVHEGTKEPAQSPNKPAGNDIYECSKCGSLIGGGIYAEMVGCKHKWRKFNASK